ncbi:MAG: hypothetical protein IPJ20_07845 [Flammeovirgaceae bacterium]|nr:hypothetical protein [Flammeovirgaceae bacterium]
MLRIKKGFVILIFCCGSNLLSAQTFETLYKKLDSLYLLEDFSGCLQLESVIVPLIGARQDTLVANTLFYIGDSYRNDFKMEVALSYFLRERDLA